MHDVKVVGIIPARYASSRRPGKPLAQIAGKSMIQRVYEQCSASTLLQSVCVATDDRRIEDAVAAFGGHAVMTRADHPVERTGSPRPRNSWARILSSISRAISRLSIHP